MNRGLEKNNEGERLTKQETKNSGEISETHSGFGKGKPQARVCGQSPQPPTDFYKKNTHFSEVFLSKKDTPVFEILTTRIGIYNNARAKGGAMAPCPPCVRLYGPSIFFNKKKLKSSHGRPPRPSSLVTPLFTGTCSLQHKWKTIRRIVTTSMMNQLILFDGG